MTAGASTPNNKIGETIVRICETAGVAELATWPRDRPRMVDLSHTIDARDDHLPGSAGAGHLRLT